jgi:tRNA-2-methylthio-N6-dimethylallyladenosine synthase
MGRKYTKEQYLEIIQKLRQARPEIVLSTDLIVGFPGETERDFQETLDLVEQICFDSCFSFKYSDRPGVRAESMPRKVPENEKSARLNALQKIQDNLTVNSLNSLVGQKKQVLIEGKSSKKCSEGISFKGREPGGRVVNCRYKTNEDLTGHLVLVNILQAKKHSVFGEVLKYYD